MTALTGTFWSPNYPLDYKNHASCKWEIIVPSNYIISVTFEDVTLERTCCWCDYVEVRETLKNGSAVLITKFCDDTKPDPSQQFRSTSSSVTVIFRSDATVHAKGFKASYQAVPLPGKKINYEFDMHISALIYAGFYSQYTVLYDLLYRFISSSQNTIFKREMLVWSLRETFITSWAVLYVSLVGIRWPNYKRGGLQIERPELANYGWGYCVLLYQVYKWVMANSMRVVTCNELVTHAGRVDILLVALYCKTRDKP